MMLTSDASNIGLEGVKPQVVPTVTERAHMACMLCGGRGKQLFAKFGYLVARCEVCGLVYCDHRPSLNEVVLFYSEEYFKGGIDRRGYFDYEADEALLKASFLPKLQLVNRLAPRIGSLLDVGCAAGYFMEVAREAGWRPYGVEASLYAARQAKRRGLLVVHGISLDMFRSEQFDAVTLWDVLEHLPDPLAALKAVHYALRPDGLLALCTGRIDSWLARLSGQGSRIYNPPQHLFFFSRASIEKLLTMAGFEVLKVMMDKKIVSLRYLLHMYRSFSGNGALPRMAARLLRSSFNMRIPLWIPDNMNVFARKL